MWNDMRNCFYISVPKVSACRPGTPDDSLVVDRNTYLKLCQMSLHSSQYAKLSSRYILPYNEYVAHTKVLTASDGGDIVHSHV